MKLSRSGIKFGLLTILNIFSFSASSEIYVAAFEDVNSSILKASAPLIQKQLNGRLMIVELWQDYGAAFKVDSTLKLIGQNEFIVTLTGDIPQNKFMAKDGYAIVACHEIGHILGNWPHQKKSLVKWSAVEGQADYYATNECMWRYIRDVKAQDNVKRFDQDIVAQCEAAYRDNLTDTLGCLRIISSIVDMQNYFNDTSSKDHPVDYRRKDPSVVDITLEKYPSDQCRIDTMMAGVLKQPRPACWFAG